MEADKDTRTSLDRKSQEEDAYLEVTITFKRHFTYSEILRKISKAKLTFSLI